jgi:hypothetical protein
MHMPFRTPARDLECRKHYKSLNISELCLLQIIVRRALPLCPPPAFKHAHLRQALPNSTEQFFAHPTSHYSCRIQSPLPLPLDAKEAMASV